MALLKEGFDSELEPDLWDGSGDTGGSTGQPVQPVQPTVIPGPVEVADTQSDPIATAGDPMTPPATIDPSLDTGSNVLDGGSQSSGDPSVGGTSVQDLYPEAPELGTLDAPDVPDATGADVIGADAGVAEVGTPGVAETDTGQIVDDASQNVGDTVGTGEQTQLTDEQRVDAELARILGQDSPLLAQARAEAARFANQRGLMNSSMAAGMTYDAMVKAAMPMAQQNADQALQREMANTALRQEANIFTAEEQNRLAALEAELGQELSIFNADQLNQAERLSAEMRTAIEQGNQQAFNEAAMQLAELQRNAEAQQAEMDYAASEREFLERQAYNEQIIDSVTALNEQFMIGEQQIDIEHVRGTYQQIISTNETAASIYDSYLSSIGQIFDNPDMSTSQTAEAVRQMVNALEGSLRMISEINGMEFSPTIGLPTGSRGSVPYEPPPVPPGGEIP